MLPSLCLLMFLFPLHSAHTHRGSPGLLCTNDFVNTVSCFWTGSPLGSGDDCWVSGVKDHFIKGLLLERCKLKQRGSSPPGCSLVFNNTHFSTSEVMPNISLTCGGRLMKILTNYTLNDHIKMHPPEAPRLNDTHISWSPGDPVSYLFKNTFDFHIQVKQSHQTWAESKNLFTQGRTWERMPVEGLKGLLEARVKVKPTNREKCHWSDWSPTTSYFVRTESTTETSNKQGWRPTQISLTVTGIFLAIIVVVLTLYKICHKLLKRKPVPDPSKYFETLYKGDVKTWPKHESETESFFVAQSSDNISPVEVCGDWCVVGPLAFPSSSSTSALLPFQNNPPSGSDSSGFVYNSSSLTNFSNVGYFTSSSSGGSARTEPGPAYFTYNNHLHNLPNIRHPFLYDPLHSSPDYESLKREPESPDSGFGIMSQDERSDHSCIKQEEVLNQRSFHIVSLHLPTPMRPPSSSSTPPHPPSEAQVSSDSQQLDVPEATAAAGARVSAAQPVAAFMSRSSSMPVEPFKTGYLTLKELQTTFSNKSI